MKRLIPENKKKTINISQVLMLMFKKEKQTKVTYKDLVDSLGDQAFGLIIIIFALPSTLPLSIIPGFSFLFSLPLIFIAVHLIIGKQTLWLPASLAKKQINSKKLSLVIKKTVPYLMKIEHLLKPRALFLTSKGLEFLHGLLLLLLSTLLVFPIPFSNFFLAVLIILLGLGLAQRDGVMIIVAYLGAFTLIFLFSQLTQTLLRML